ncbi:hypothetical protein M9Y10_010219 [Tritrichomonas musculus]|uniref:DUF3447 domain-containing protein n=1 Tax=Tritrichomonas musculus TaxID=1915356 RepID=A0ABR2IQL7_9EUKA
METKQYLTKYIKIQNYVQSKLLEYLDDELNEKYEDQILSYLDKQNIRSNKYQLKELLHWLSKLSKNHHRSVSFLSKIEGIIKHYQVEIQNFFSNFDIFNIFKNSKRILLFLFEEKMIHLDSSILQNFKKAKYIRRNYPEFFICEQNICNPKHKTDDIFIENRRIGENESYICKLIQKDLIEDFISHVTRTNLRLNSLIPSSIFETNSFLLCKNVTLIEYATFFGSIQIVKYLFLNNVVLKPSLWLYAVHGRNPDMIHFLEENRVYLSRQTKDEIYQESIKCFHNELANYFQNNHNINKNQDMTFYTLQCHNYNHFVEKDINIIDNVDFNIFQKLIEFDYFFVVNYFFKNKRLEDEIYETKHINYKDQEVDISLLHIAVLKRKTEIVEILIDLIDPNIKFLKRIKYDLEIESLNSLFLAVEDGNHTIVNLLLSNPKTDPTIELINQAVYGKYIYKECSLLHAASENGNIEIFKTLLALPNIDINCIYNDESCSNKTPLHFALEKNNTLLAKLLLENEKIDVSIDLREKRPLSDKYDVKSALFLAVENENVELVKLILTKPNNSFITTFCKNEYIVAAEKENLEIIKLLLTRPEININYLFSDETIYKKIYKNALFIAVEKNNLEMVKILLTHPKIDIDINSTITQDDLIITKTPLFVAYENENYEIMKELLSKSSKKVLFSYKSMDDTHKIRTNEFIASVEKENVEMIKFLLKMQTIDVNNRKIEEKFDKKNHQLLYRSEKSALSIAVEKENIEIIKLLLKDPNIDINIKSIEYKDQITVEKTPLYDAVEKENIKIISQLLLMPSIDWKTYSYKSFNNDTKIESNELIKAVEKNNFPILYHLLKRQDIDVNFKQIITEQNKTFEMSALSIAIENESIEIIKLLLDNQNIDINLVLTDSCHLIDESKYLKVEKTVLQSAVIKGNIEIVELILSHQNIDINMNILEYDEFFEYHEYKKANKQKTITKKIRKIISKQRTALHTAISSKNIDIISILLSQKGINLDVRDEEGKLPIEYTQDDMIKKLFCNN